MFDYQFSERRPVMVKRPLLATRRASPATRATHSALMNHQTAVAVQQLGGQKPRHLEGAVGVGPKQEAFLAALARLDPSFAHGV